jgi:hypothetical protein
MGSNVSEELLVSFFRMKEYCVLEMEAGGSSKVLVLIY